MQKNKQILGLVIGYISNETTNLQGLCVLLGGMKYYYQGTKLGAPKTLWVKVDGEQQMGHGFHLEKNHMFLITPL